MSAMEMPLNGANMQVEGDKSMVESSVSRKPVSIARHADNAQQSGLAPVDIVIGFWSLP
jgi:hypothetical protein